MPISPHFGIRFLSDLEPGRSVRTFGSCKGVFNRIVPERTPGWQRRTVHAALPVLKAPQVVSDGLDGSVGSNAPAATALHTAAVGFDLIAARPRFSSATQSVLAV
jgi:hypothetical protein